MQFWIKNDFQKFNSININKTRFKLMICSSLARYFNDWAMMILNQKIIISKLFLSTHTVTLVMDWCSRYNMLTTVTFRCCPGVQGPITWLASPSVINWRPKGELLTNYQHINTKERTSLHNINLYFVYTPEKQIL